ncbi:MAG: hypothetical protein AB1609_23205 [Bacillota bacterium]
MHVKKPWVRAAVGTLAFAILALAVVAPGVLAAASASATQNVTVTIPQRVGIKLNPSSITIDLTNQNYPPDTFPAYYGTSSAPAVVVSVFANSPAGFTVTVTASGNPPTWLPFTDWYVAAGTNPGDATPARTAEGETPDTMWKALSTSQTIIDKTNEKTAGWDDYNVDFQLKFNGDEEATTISGVTLTYTITAK